ncbi:CBS domain-containing protein [Mucilaginibacter corticis]|uniref:CBS domain-containing protein n=1 Tax=Mucilaginibacter corticis TaxID=2597670 RepID=A0A556MUS6_9SPHI|nr:CBS domain-containing protein [Mucilaginibacter corticis]TSJ43559.1 CBS domain-containing protein [Mucilaginibacter corticis]
MRKVSDILARKGSSVFAIDADTLVLDALRLMADKNIGSVVVTKNGEYAGILTERDYARKVILEGRSSDHTTVGEIMGTSLPVLLPDNTIDHCMHIMTESKLRYLPVFSHNKLSGIISMSDVVTETILSHEDTIEQLKNYIQS